MKISTILVLVLLLISNLSYSQQQSVLRVAVREKQTIRDVAKEYLNDPDLWEEILKSNKLRSPSDVKTGMVLTIPYNQIMRAKKAIDEALVEIQKATTAGAKSFASDLMTKAIASHTQAIKERKSGNWDKSYQLGSEAKQEALNAAQEASMKSATKGEATLSFSKGKVESKKSIENLWRSIPVLAKIIENDRVRTLSDSYAEVAFQDKSKIRLSENSQAVIQRNRVDLLTNRSEAKVTLEKGDAFALLAGGAQGKKKFNLETPGLEATVRSKTYWVSKDDKTAKVANYDGEIDLKSKNSKITLKSNQGASLLASGTLTQPKDLLKRPNLTSPVNEKIVYENKISLEWSKVDGADKYWLQISRDATFKTAVFQSKEMKSTAHNAELERGSYYWRAAAIDKDGFPGPFSDARLFTLIVNNEAPYLTVSEPATNVFVTKNEIDIKGNTESLVRVSINGETLTVDASGAFEKHFLLHEGVNVFDVVAIDSSGNKSTITRKVDYSKGQGLFLKYDLNTLGGEKQIYTTNQSLTIKGSTTAETFVTAISHPTGLKVAALSDSTGEFRFTISRLTTKNTVIVEAKNKEGKILVDTMYIYLDKELPEIRFNDEIPEKTSDNSLAVIGFVSNAAALRLNGSVIEIKQNKFQTLYALKEGLNELLFIATNKNGAKTKVYRKIFLDSAPPELINYKAVPAKITGTGIVAFEIKASDKTGLKKTAKLIYQLGEDLFTIYLRLDENTQTYRASENCSFAGSADVKIRLILLEDQLGNLKEYNFLNQDLKK